MSLWEQYEIALLIETVIDLKRHHIQSELHVLHLTNVPEHRAEAFNGELTVSSVIEKSMSSKRHHLTVNF